MSKSGSTGDIVAVNEEDISYFKEMLGSTLSKLSLGAAFATVIPAALVGGPALALFPLIAWAGGASIAALFVPSSPVFRNRVNRRIRSERREEIRSSLLNKLARPTGRTRDLVKVQGMSLLEADVDLARLAWQPSIETYRPQYQRMMKRVHSLNDLAQSDENPISPEDVERLLDSTVDFLRLVYARLNLLDRIASSRADEVQHQIHELEVQAENAPPALRSQLDRARADLERTAAQVSQLPARDAAVSAQLLYMSETFEELSHRITSNPAAGDMSSFLEEATQKLSIEEELDWATASELDNLQRARRHGSKQHQ